MQVQEQGMRAEQQQDFPAAAAALASQAVCWLLFLSLSAASGTATAANDI